MVKTEDLTKTYTLGEVEVTALNGVNLEVRQGEFLAIMGVSGSGKSTLLHTIGGIDRATSGNVWIDGECISEMDDTKITLFRRNTLGFVFQFFNLIPTLTVEENIALPLLIAGKNLNKYTTKINDLLHFIGLSERRLHKPSQLSGGEQQRVAIARAFVIEPKMVLLDEPTGNLDSKTSSLILDLVAKTHQQFQTTIMMVSHNPIDAAYAERTVFLKDGAIVDIMEKGKEIVYTAETINTRLLSL
jgi:putative ABC transport system ATP-binding protein